MDSKIPKLHACKQNIWIKISLDSRRIFFSCHSLSCSCICVPTHIWQALYGCPQCPLLVGIWNTHGSNWQWRQTLSGSGVCRAHSVSRNMIMHTSIYLTAQPLKLSLYECTRALIGGRGSTVSPVEAYDWLRVFRQLVVSCVALGLREEDTHTRVLAHTHRQNIQITANLNIHTRIPLTKTYRTTSHSASTPTPHTHMLPIL